MDENGGWPYLMYLFFLLWGFVIVSDERLQDSIRRLRWVSLSAGLVLAAGSTIVYSQVDNLDVISPSLILVGLMRTFGGWSCVLAFFGLAMQYLTARTPRLDYASEAVLPFYILHQTVLMAVGYFVLQWGIPDVLEWAIVVVISFAVIMGIYDLLVRRINVLRFLFGMKPLPTKPAQETQQVLQVR
jgi:surface polysaccharide O-acyltransferase-like enzyme